MIPPGGRTPTVLITGCSSGIGRAAAELFAERGFNVSATMRSPEADVDDGRASVIRPRLDVLDRDSIDAAVRTTLDRFGSLDVLVNNAGYAVLGPLEAIPPESVDRQFATNVLGLIATTQAVLPHFRAQAHGVIVNVSSIVGRTTLPLGSVYNASKFAVEGLSEALTFELAAIGTRVKIVEPGLVATDFATRSMQFHAGPGLDAYQPVVAAVGRASERMAAESEPVSVVAETIWRAATDGTAQLRYPAGATAARALDEAAHGDDAERLTRTRERFGL